jgi:ABC-type transporter Mla subunit MlaD
MKTLDELHAKLDTVLESQGRLAARLDELDGQLWTQIGAMAQKLDGRLQGAADGIGSALADLRKDLTEARKIDSEYLENQLEGLRHHLQESLLQVANAIRPTRRGGPRRESRRRPAKNTRVPGRNKRPKQS